MPNDPDLIWDERYRQVPALELSEVLDGFVVFDPARDRLHYLNPTAAAVLQMCDGSLRATDIADVLRAAFQLPSTERDAIGDCLQTLVNERLIVTGEVA